MLVYSLIVSTSLKIIATALIDRWLVSKESIPTGVGICANRFGASL
jgi:hypothetical protein